MKYFLSILLIFFTLNSFKVLGEEIIEMKKEADGLYIVPCEVNGLKLRFILDTGASFVSISLTEATFMLKNGYLNESDITGTTNIQTADGNIAENYVINLNEIKIGNIILRDVPAVVSSGLDAPLLLGQSVLDQLGHWSIKDGKLILNESENENKEIFNAERVKSILTNDPERGLEIVKNIINRAINSYIDQDDIEIIRYVIYESNLPFKLKDRSYYALYITYEYQYNDEQQARQIATEAINNNCYELLYTYCFSDLLLNNNYSEAYPLLLKAHENGYKNCSVLLGKGYLNNQWEEKNITKGLLLLDQLSKEGYEEASLELCDYYWDKEDYNKMLEYARNLSYEYTKNIYEAISYFNKKDYSIALNRLGFVNPNHLHRSDLKSQYYFIKGQTYENGLGCNPDFNKAFESYEKMIDYDAGWAYGFLGDMFYLNELIEEDPLTAYKYYVLGANNENGYCCFRVALMNYYGEGTPENKYKANEYKEKAIKLGFKESDFKF